MGFPTIATFAAAGLQAAGQVQQGQAAAASAGYNAKVAARNAEIATQNANFAGAQGEQNVGIQGMKNAARIGDLRANQGASGVDVNTGSSVPVRESLAKVGMLDALTLRSNAVKEAYRSQVEAASYKAQSELDRAQQSADKRAGFINAGATILGGAGKAAMFASGGTPDNFSKYLTESDNTAGITNIGSYNSDQGLYPYNISGNNH